MKKFKTLSVGLAAAGSLSAQSLYDLAPDDTQLESLPLRWTAGVNFGYDDNPLGLQGIGEESAYGQAYVGAAFLTNTPQSTLNFGAQLGVIHFFENLDLPGLDVDDTSFTAAVYLNWTHRVSERLRFVSRNRLSYELEPDYSTGFQAQQQVGNYFQWSTDNAVGYRWSERFATYTGFRLYGLTYDDISGSDRSTWELYNDFRYQVSPRTVATLSYRYADTSGDAFVTDSTNHYLLVGLEHKFSTTTTGVVRAGAQFRDVDGGDSSTSPYLEASLNHQVNEQFRVRSYARYGIEDYSRSLTNFTLPGNPFAIYSNTKTLRLGVDFNYQATRALGLVAGVNYAMLDYDDLQAGFGVGSVDEDMLNLYIGFDMEISNNLFLNGRYNFEDYASDAGRDYDRNRVSLGISTTF